MSKEKLDEKETIYATVSRFCICLWIEYFTGL